MSEEKIKLSDKELQKCLDELKGTNFLNAFCILDWIVKTREENNQLKKANKELSRMCELYSKSLYNADLKKAEVKINKVNQAIDDLLVFNDFNGTTSGIGNVKEELKFYLSDCKTLEEFRNLEKGGSNE